MPKENKDKWQVVTRFAELRPGTYQEKTVVLMDYKDYDGFNRLKQQVSDLDGEFAELPERVKKILEAPTDFLGKKIAFAYWGKKTNSHFDFIALQEGDYRIKIEDNG